MPLVDGERIDRWCEAKAPDAHAIVRLYLQVCGAVAYAHRNLVIHRDIKPSNVLVDDDGHVRLLDFGIGQFADTQDERTQPMWPIGSESCRERVCQYGKLQWVGVSLKKKKKTQ